MTVRVAYSQNTDPVTASLEIKTSFAGLDPVVVLFFASSRYNPNQISSAMKHQFPDTTVMGCSTAGEIVSGMMLTDSLVAMALESDIISEIHSDVIDLSDNKSPSRTIISIAEQFGCKPIELDPESYVGLILIDGLSCAEEQVMEKIGDIVNIPVIGGSAGDDLAFEATWVYLDGNAYQNSAILTILKPGCHYDIIKTQSFCGMNKILTPTQVDEASRKVIEFNGKPAVTAYAEAIGIPEQNAAEQFMNHPVGLIAGDEPFVRSPQRVDGTDMHFYCQIKSGVDLMLLSSTDIITDTREALRAMEKKAGTIKGLINFHCILRTLQLNQEKKSSDYGALFSQIPMIGFSTYGEEYIGHINQTSTMLVFY
ncbi:MAG: FIST C-terminal domain-containing protein [Methanospirillaceae archaeon]|nr:FIST C-terminal domain-containing protein [Methanospirillaceae archaeon]